MEKQRRQTTTAKIAVKVTPYEGNVQTFSLKSGGGCGGGACSGGGSCGKCGMVAIKSGRCGGPSCHGGGPKPQ